MGVLQRFRGAQPTHEHDDATTSGSKTPPDASEHADLEKEAGQRLENGPVHVFSLRVFTMAIIVSIGGLIFGYDTGQISGFLEMPNFLALFGDTTKDGQPAFSNTRSGTIVALVCSSLRSCTPCSSLTGCSSLSERS
jgi:SP family sugar:H+ symporter-like MFS transporter